MDRARYGAQKRAIVPERPRDVDHLASADPSNVTVMVTLLMPPVCDSVPDDGQCALHCA